MLIRCPECEFEREIDPDGIASTAVRATCPRCKSKFYFRNADGSFIEFMATPASPQEPSVFVVPPNAPPAASEPSVSASDTSSQIPEDDPLPPGAVIPDVPSMTRSRPDPQDEAPVKTKEAGPVPTSSVPQGRKAAPLAPKNAKGSQKEKSSFLSAFEERLREAKIAFGLNKTSEAPDTADAADEPREDKSPSSAAKAAAHEGNDQDIPWELPEKYGFLPSLYQTILRVLFGAPRFFAALPQTTTPWIRPVAFYVILGMFQTVMERTWYLMSFQAMGPSIADPKVQELLGAMAHEMSLPMALLLSPMTLFMQLAFYTALFFMMVRLVHPESASFSLMLRIIAYSSAPAVVCVVPLVGTLANAVWFAVCCCVGCKYALNMPWSRVLLALGPLYLVAFAVLGQFMRQLMG